jgi:hypothetical protein
MSAHITVCNKGCYANSRQLGGAEDDRTHGPGLGCAIESWPILGGDHVLSAERNPASSGTRDELLFIFAGLVPSLAVRSENACRLTTKAVLARTCSIDAGNVPSQSRVHYNRTAHGMDLFR